jgi:hypothetical protein
MKAHLIRGALYLLLLPALFVIPLTLGQRGATNSHIDGANMRSSMGLSSTIAIPETQGSISPPPEFTPIALWDQYNSAGVDRTLSAAFTDSPAMNSDLADDFVVPAGYAWWLRSIEVDGAYFNGLGPANSFNVYFYYDNDGFPGMQVYGGTINQWTQNGSTFTIHLSDSCCEPEFYPGRYWVEIQANMTAMCCGEWGWTDRTIASVNPAVWRNPSGFFGACQSWGRRGVTCGLDATAPDQVYRVSGNLIFLPTPTPEPTPPLCDSGLITNGGFETGSFSPWMIQDTAAPPLVTNTQSHNGSYSGFVGGDGTQLCGYGPEPVGFSSFYQQFTVPANGGTLSFWHWDCAQPGLESDYQAAYITDTSNHVVQTIFRHLSEESRWIQQLWDLAPYAGQPIRVKFLVYQNGFGITGMYVDDVQLLQRCSPRPAPTPRPRPDPAPRP